MPPAVGSPIAVDTRERVSAPFPSESELSSTSPGRPSSSDNPIDSPLSTDERLLAMDPGQPGSHYGNARQLSPRRGLRALQGPSFDIFAQNEVDTQGPGQDLRHPDAGTTHQARAAYVALRRPDAVELLGHSARYNKDFPERYGRRPHPSGKSRPQ